MSMSKRILNVAAMAFIILIVTFILVSAVTPTSAFINKNIIGSANALSVNGLAVIKISPTVHYPILSLRPILSLVPTATAQPSMGGTFTYNNPTTPTPTINATEIPSIIATPTAVPSTELITVAPPTATPVPANASFIDGIITFIKGLFGLK